jgi:hypothetical protein
MRETHTGAIVAFVWSSLSARSSASAFRSFPPLVRRARRQPPIQRQSD